MIFIWINISRMRYQRARWLISYQMTFIILPWLDGRSLLYLSDYTARMTDISSPLRIFNPNERFPSDPGDFQHNSEQEQSVWVAWLIWFNLTKCPRYWRIPDSLSITQPDQFNNDVELTQQKTPGWGRGCFYLEIKFLSFSLLAFISVTWSLNHSSPFLQDRCAAALRTEKSSDRHQSPSKGWLTASYVRATPATSCRTKIY